MLVTDAYMHVEKEVVVITQYEKTCSFMKMEIMYERGERVFGLLFLSQLGYR